MRVLFVSQELPPETGWGGIGTYVDVLSEALAAKGTEVHVLSVVEGQPSSRNEVGGVTVHRHPLPRGNDHARLPPETLRRLRLPARVSWLIRELGLDPEVVECPEWGAEGLALAIGSRFPLVVRLHSWAKQLFPYTDQGKKWHGVDGRISSWLEKASARRAHVVVSTRSNLDEVAAAMRLDDRALHAIPYPVRLPSLSPMPPGESPRVTFVGRLEPRKAPDVVLRAAPKVLAAFPDARFVFVGREATRPGGPCSLAWLRSEAQRLGIAKAITLTGHLDPEGVAEELRRSSMGVFPSRWESFGNVVAEAAVLGRPVVASPIPPFRELVEDGRTGRLVPLDDPHAWAEAIVEILSDRDRAAELGRAGAARVSRISDPSRVADQAVAAHEHAIHRWRVGERAGKR